MDNRAPTTRANSASSFSRFGELAAVFFKTKFSDGLLAQPLTLPKSMYTIVLSVSSVSRTWIRSGNFLASASSTAVFDLNIFKPVTVCQQS